jgi:hypothetical protein
MREMKRQRKWKRERERERGVIPTAKTVSPSAQFA